MKHLRFLKSTTLVIAIALGLALAPRARATITQTMPDQAKVDFTSGLTVMPNAYATGVANTVYTVGTRTTNSGNTYELTTAMAGNSTTAPTGTTTSSDNSGVWTYKEAADVYKMALYTSSATLDATSKIYSTTNEVTGTGYTAGGNTLTGLVEAVASNHAQIDFADSAWTSSTITARGAVIYNSTKGNRIVGIYDFGADKTSTSGTFTVQISAGVIAIN